MTTDSIEIAKEDGKNYRSVRLRVSDSGLRIDAHDMGPNVEGVWSSDDYEFWVNVKPSDFPALLKALLLEKYRGNMGAVDAFHEFCKTHEIPCEWESWP